MAKFSIGTVELDGKDELVMVLGDQVFGLGV